MREDLYINYIAHMLDEAFGDEQDTRQKYTDATFKKYRHAESSAYDEFYIKYDDVDPMIRPFSKHFRNKRIFMNCDSPNKSYLYLYMLEHFDEFGLKELAAIGYEDKEMDITYPGGQSKKVPVSNDGDLTKGESLQKLDDCDIVVGNPPFSHKLGRQFFDLALKHGRDVIGIETPDHAMSSELLNPIIDGKLKVYHCPYDTFNVPVDDEGNQVRQDTGKYIDRSVRVFIFSTFKDANQQSKELKRDLAPLFEKAKQVGMRYEDLPEIPQGKNRIIDNKVDVRMTFDREGNKGGGSYSDVKILPPKPKSNGISVPFLAFPPTMLDYNWEKYFRAVGVVNVNGEVFDPISGKKFRDFSYTKMIKLRYK